MQGCLGTTTKQST